MSPSQEAKQGETLGDTGGAPVKHIHPLVGIDYPVRAVAYLFTGLMLLSVIMQHPTSTAVLTLLAGWTLVWPHLAYQIGKRSSDSKRVELRNLQVDSFMLGVCSALVGFDILATATMFTAINAAHLSTGGMRAALTGSFWFALGGVLAGMNTGYVVHGDSSVLTTVLSLVGMTIFTATFGIQSNNAVRGVIKARRELEERNRFIDEQRRQLDEARKVADLARRAADHAREAAEQANQAKSAFLANMSHELRTPLNAVIGFSDMMDHQVFGPLGHPKYREYVSYIASSGTHLLTLISDILDMSKVEAGKVALRAETMAVADVLNDAAIMIAPRATEAGVTLVQEASGGTHFHVDRRYALQVALNLISNAINFTPRGGTIWLDVVSAGEQAGFRVRDTGVGLAPEDIPAVLQPFGQMRNPGQTHGEGVGLGLPLAKKLVELHGGRLFIDSTLGRGTTVTAVFPGPARQGEGRSRRG